MCNDINAIRILLALLIDIVKQHIHDQLVATMNLFQRIPEQIHRFWILEYLCKFLRLARILRRRLRFDRFIHHACNIVDGRLLHDGVDGFIHPVRVHRVSIHVRLLLNLMVLSIPLGCRSI